MALQTLGFRGRCRVFLKAVLPMAPPGALSRGSWARWLVPPVQGLGSKREVSNIFIPIPLSAILPGHTGVPGPCYEGKGGTEAGKER